MDPETPNMNEKQSRLPIRNPPSTKKHYGKKSASSRCKFRWLAAISFGFVISMMWWTNVHIHHNGNLFFDDYKPSDKQITDKSEKNINKTNEINSNTPTKSIPCQALPYPPSEQPAPFLQYPVSHSSAAVPSFPKESSSTNQASFTPVNFLTRARAQEDIPLMLSEYVNTYPNRLHGSLPYVHDYFRTSISDRDSIVFVAQNMRRCDQGDFSDEPMEYWLNQVSLLQGVDIVKENSNIRVSNSYEEATDTNTRFICRFQDGSETVSKYFFDYELIMGVKGYSTLVQAKRDHYVVPSTILFHCPIPTSTTTTNTAVAQTATASPPMTFDLVVIQTITRDGFKLNPETRDLFPDVSEPLERIYDIETLLSTHQSNTMDVCDHDTDQHNGVVALRNLPLFQPISDSPPTLYNLPKSDQSPHHYKHKIAACLWSSKSYRTRTNTKFNNGDSRLIEWMEFHFMIGLDHVYLYDNSQDSADTLARAADLFGPEKITRIVWPHKICNNMAPGSKNPGERSSQYSAEASCLKRYGGEAEWMMTIDVDEYIIPMGDNNSLQDLLQQMEGRGVKVMNLASVRSKLRKELTVPVTRSTETEDVDDINSCENVKPHVPCRVKMDNATFLEAYNCNVGYKEWGGRAQKQIFRTDYMIHHFVHYSVVTKSLLEPLEDGKRPRKKHDANEVVSVVDEALLIHAKGMIPWSAKSANCFGEGTERKFIEGKLNTCLLGTEYFLNNEGVRVRSEKADDVGTGFDVDERMVNCFSNRKVDEFYLPMLKARLSSKATETTMTTELSATKVTPNELSSQMQSHPLMDYSAIPPPTYDTESNLMPPPVELIYAENFGTGVDDILVNLQPLIGTHKETNNAIFALAENYDLKKFVHFLESLRDTGYEGDVVLSITSDHNDDLISYLRSFDSSKINLVSYAVVWDCTSKKDGLEIGTSTNGGKSDCVIHGIFGSKSGEIYRDLRSPRPIATARYELYYIWCKQYSARSKIMMIDFRDSYFVTDPFDDSKGKRGENSIGEGEVHLFAEHNPSVTIKTSNFNRKWIQDCYGKEHLNKFGDESVVCSGSTIGEKSSVEVYLMAMVFQYDATKCKMKGADQGFHNYLFYSGTLTGLVGDKVTVFKQGEGTINNLAAMREKPLVEYGVIKEGDAEMIVRNWDGMASSVVHQYDRDPDLKKWRQDFEMKLVRELDNKTRF